MLKYIIVQAGGKGTRMGKLTRNKPKALVPVNNLPMIFHLFRAFPDRKFIVIGDYQYEVLERYLREFAEVDYQLVRGTGHTGTCAGLSQALSYVPEGERFMLIWCDLLLPEDYVIPESAQNVIGISKDFSCRWKYEDGVFQEEKSAEFGVAGHFIFKDKSWLADVPEEGEFVRWLQGKGYTFEPQGLYKTHEYGLYEEWDKLQRSRCRPFNRMEFLGDKVVKTPIDDQGRKLAVRETAWYQALQGANFPNIPTIYTTSPLCMERIDGKNIYEYTEIPQAQKREILKQIIDCLRSIHQLQSIPADRESYRVAYLDKTYDRLKKVRDLVPFANDETVTVNGRVCRNVFYHQPELEALVMQYVPSEFRLIHGDCTFSNIMLKQDGTPVLIDPRGYFGTTELYGDVAYDWAKLYYSLFSNYDQFNLKRFDLKINQDGVELDIESNQWECMESYFFELLDGEITKPQLKLLLAIIWLSLTTYAWEDYDSICGAFYQGLYYLEEILP
jgi:GTP:adenosylcobinamide-phosphate guanylyltransferase/aminoglycoside phosphotransferase